ncbi:MAG: hypothetical protein EA422_01040 [Gemmatimonadales bacterium]|nr:MAG: hypothetical protein EA422_01040 [Gemmatimonadales bacterium]
MIQSNFIGRTPELDAAGNYGPGILIGSGLEDVTSLSVLIGYQQGNEIPFGNTSQFSAAVLLSELTDEIFQDHFD